jgi:hypothetical protein
MTGWRRLIRALLAWPIALLIPAPRGFGAATVPAQLHSEAETRRRFRTARAELSRSGAPSSATHAAPPEGS